ncbi:zinc finger MYM-type protein 5-like [Metopolophium dirhodum]|uniref:zinc finger MYM-type protein 5-like n=1 Tax=Metopolophium dirhodum TaxID=44670 RepID=UPI002990575B|nr:zinc finger MYM-type protein 5-like [Metopolophium dirhodum]
MQGKWLRSFHEEHYYKKLPNGKFVKRTWISYSPSQDKVFCIVCKQFGKEDAISYQLARFGSDDWSHISFKLKSNSVHLESEIRRAMFVSNQRVISTIFESSNRNVSENREIVRVIFESLIYLARQNITFRGRNESWTPNKQGHFIELIKFISKYNPTLSSHLSKIQNSKKKNRLTFLSNLS